MTQHQRILDHLRSGRTITALDAFNQLGITQVASRIFELKREGHPISKRTVRVVNRYDEICYVAEYYYKSLTIDMQLTDYIAEYYLGDEDDS